MPIENKKLLIELEHVMREMNRDTLNSLFGELTTEDVLPIMEMTAKARGNYMDELFSLSKLSKQGQNLNPELVKKLRFSRLIFDELVHAYQALDVAIEHGYLDVKH